MADVNIGFAEILVVALLADTFVDSIVPVDRTFQTVFHNFNLQLRSID